MPEQAIDPVTLAEAGRILGCSKSAARRRILAARGSRRPAEISTESLSRVAVEQLALTLYRWRDHLDELESYWITGQRAADVLGVNVARINVLAAKGFIPFETHADGTRLYRREQLEIVAQSRDARWGRR